MYKSFYSLRYTMWYNAAKIMIHMKLTVWLVALASMQVTANTYGQKITIHSKNGSLKTILEKLRHQTGKDFLYNSNEVDENRKVTLSVKGESWEKTLGALLQPQGLTYKVNGKTVLIQPIRTSQ